MKGAIILMNTSKNTKSTSKKRIQRKRSEDSTVNSGLLHTIKNSLFGALIGISSAFILMTLGTVICYSSSDPNAFVDTVALVSLYLSSLICGFAAVKKNRSSALFCGTISGIFMMLFFIICSLFLGEGSEATFNFPVSILLRVAIVAASVLGAYVGLKRGTNKKRPRKASR